MLIQIFHSHAPYTATVIRGRKQHLNKGRLVWGISSVHKDIRNTREQATRKGKQEAVTWRAVWSCTSPGTGKQAAHPSVQAELGPVRMCGGKWESVEQQQPVEEINITERYKRSQKLSKVVKNLLVSCMSQSAVTIIYTGPLLSPASFSRTAALSGNTLHRHPEVDACKRHLMDMGEPMCSSHRAGSDNPSSHMPVLYLQKALPSPINTLFISEVTRCYCNDDWLGNLLKVILSSHRPQHLLQLKPVQGHWGTEGEELLNSLLSVSLTSATHWEVAFKQPKGNPLSSSGLC